MEQLYGVESNYVDWHRFLLCAALPFPWPLPTSQDLLEAWHALVTDPDTVGRKRVAKERFMAAEMWLEKLPEYQEELTGTFDRNRALKNVKITATICVLCYYSRTLIMMDTWGPKHVLIREVSLLRGETVPPNESRDFLSIESPDRGSTVHYSTRRLRSCW